MKRIGLCLAAVCALVLPTGPPALAASCNGASHEVALFDGRAAPASVALGAPITFSVQYSDSAECVPTAMSVTIAGVGSFGLTTAGTSFATGVTYAIAITLPAGAYPYSFSVTSGSGGGVKTVGLAAVNPASAVVQAPPPPPPPPTATPIPAPAPRPPPPPTPRPATPAPLPPLTAAPTATASPTASPSAESATAAPTEVVPASSVPASGPPAASLHDSWPRTTSTPPGMASVSPRSRGIDLAIPGTVLAYLVSTGAGLAFYVFLLRRRPVADSSAAQLIGAGESSAAPASDNRPLRVTPLPPMRELIPPIADLLSEADDIVGPRPDEVGIPRWLRPSLRAGRRGPNPGRLRGWDD